MILFYCLKLSSLQELALNACTTLVSVEPKLTMATRDRILQVSGFVEYLDCVHMFLIE